MLFDSRILSTIEMNCECVLRGIRGYRIKKNLSYLLEMITKCDIHKKDKSRCAVYIQFNQVKMSNRSSILRFHNHYYIFGFSALVFLFIQLSPPQPHCSVSFLMVESLHWRPYLPVIVLSHSIFIYISRYFIMTEQFGTFIWNGRRGSHK